MLVDNGLVNKMDLQPNTMNCYGSPLPTVLRIPTPHNPDLTLPSPPPIQLLRIPTPHGPDLTRLNPHQNITHISCRSAVNKRTLRGSAVGSAYISLCQGPYVGLL